jgi:thiol-disulfide isomerase/thioredoxin
MKKAVSAILLLVAVVWGSYIYKKYRIAPGIHPEHFKLMDTDNVPVSISGGDKDYILVNFMATWCGNCIHELPSLERLQSREKSRLNVICVSNESTNKLAIFKQQKESHLRYAQIEMISRPYFIHTFPTTYLLNKKGEILYTAVGEREWNTPETIGHLQKLMY